MKRYKKYILTLSFLLISTLFISIINVKETSSRYISSSKSTNTIKIAPWKVNINDEINSTIELDLKSTVVPNGFSISEIIPGSEGVIPIRIDTTETKVAVNYEISIDYNETLVPKNLKFYTDSTYKTTFTTITGIIPINQTKIYTVNIYWKWNYTEEDETDEWTNKNIKTKINIIAKQAIEGE